MASSIALYRILLSYYIIISSFLWVWSNFHTAHTRYKLDKEMLTYICGEFVAVFGRDDWVLCACAMYRFPAMSILSHLLTDVASIVSTLIAWSTKEMILHCYSVANLSHKNNRFDIKMHGSTISCSVHHKYVLPSKNQLPVPLPNALSHSYCDYFPIFFF